MDAGTTHDRVTERRKSQAAQRWRSVLRTVTVGFAATLLVLCALAAGDALATGDRIHAGIVAGGVPVGGMSRQKAASILEERLAGALRLPAELRYGDRRWRLDPKSFSVEIDFDATARRAWDIGRTGGLFRTAWTRARLWFGTRTIPVAAYTNRDATDRFIREVSAQVNRPPVSAALRIDGTNVLRIRAATGTAVKPRATERVLLAVMTSVLARSAELPIRIVPVGITDESVDAASSDARMMMARPLYLKHRGVTWRIAPADVGRWIAFERRVASSPGGGRQIVLEAELNRPKVERVVARMTRAATIAPRDAVFKVVGERVRIVPSKDGAGVDTEKAYQAMRRVVRARGYRSVALTMGVLRPRLTTEWAHRSGIKTLLGTYSTGYDADAASRVQNIHLLLAHLNNTFVRPGATFSFNKTIGPRTAEKGYREAPAIIGGRLVPSIGGGVCQVGTTLFNAIFFAGLDVVERHNHSFYISHYPDGRDATVSWDGPDLKFRNDTPAWVLIKAWWGDDWVTISLYGAEVNNEITYETGDFTNYVEPPMEQTADPNLPVGAVEVEDSGIRGRDITVRRTVRRDGKVIHKDAFESHYEPKAGVERTGTKSKAKPASRETTRSQSRGR